MRVTIRLSILLAALFVAGPLAAQTVRVLSGDHESFTRLVLMVADGEGWRLGRTPEGYGLRLVRPVRFDLTGVFRLIDRKRLAAIWADPEDGMLRMRLVCPCHALAYREAGGLLVIDIRDGPAPAGSAFEEVILPGEMAFLAVPGPLHPRARPPQVAILGPTWTRTVAQAARVGMTLPFDGGRYPAATAGLTEALTAELARGAARGLVDFASPSRKIDSAVSAMPAGIAAYPGGMGLTVSVVPDQQPRLAADGSTCIADQEVAIADWGDDRPVWQQLAEANAVPGEFDVPDAGRRDRAIRILLYAGFGLEAQRVIEAMPVNDQESDTLYRAMSGIIDGQPPTGSVLGGQESCDGSVAMWAFLATNPAEVRQLNSPSVRRGFSALPRHLRHLLGPDLVRRFLAIGDANAASDIQTAMERTPGPRPAGVQASAAELELESDDPEGALKSLESSPDTGPGSLEALMAEIEASARLARPVGPQTVEALEALVVEHAETDSELRLRRALVLAQALSGDFGSAVEGLTAVPDAGDAVWSLLAMAEDDAVILQAVGLPVEKIESLPSKTREAVAKRLVGLGLGPAARDWLGDPPSDIQLGAKAALLAGDARGTLRLLAGRADEVSEELRRLAASQLFSAGSDSLILPTGASLQTATWLGNWEVVAEIGDAPWKDLASLVTIAEFPVSAGLLEQGRAALGASDTTRAAIERLRSIIE